MKGINSNHEHPTPQGALPRTYTVTRWGVTRHLRDPNGHSGRTLADDNHGHPVSREA